MIQNKLKLINILLEDYTDQPQIDAWSKAGDQVTQGYEEPGREDEFNRYSPPLTEFFGDVFSDREEKTKAILNMMARKFPDNPPDEEAKKRILDVLGKFSDQGFEEFYNTLKNQKEDFNSIKEKLSQTTIDAFLKLLTVQHLTPNQVRFIDTVINHFLR